MGSCPNCLPRVWCVSRRPYTRPKALTPLQASPKETFSQTCSNLTWKNFFFEISMPAIDFSSHAAVFLRRKPLIVICLSLSSAALLLLLCVSARMCACVCACVRACVGECVCVGGWGVGGGGRSLFHRASIKAIFSHFFLCLFRMPPRTLWRQLQREMWRRLQSQRHVQPCQRNVFLFWQLENTNVCKWDTFGEYTSEC